MSTRMIFAPTDYAKGKSEKETTIKCSAKLGAFLTLFAIMQMCIVVNTMKRVSGTSVSDYADSFSMPLPEISDDAVMHTQYPCFPSRHVQQSSSASGNNSTDNNHHPTIIYLETAFINLHYETYYTYIHQLCSCFVEKDSYWTIDTSTIPQFYVGPSEMLTIGFERVLQEYNKTTCGPIYFGTPKEADLTIVTTSYPSNFDIDDKDKKGYYNLINNPQYIFICHENGPPELEENATNVYFLTPSHKRYIIPSFFPPSLVSKYSQSIRQRNHYKTSPIFLVLGSFNNKLRRSVESLIGPIMTHMSKNFTIQFLGGGSSGFASSDVMGDKLSERLYHMFPREAHSKIVVLPRTDTDDFMRHVGEADVILPLVEADHFYNEVQGYQGGKKLSSSVMWALGFQKMMILYRPLAELFGIKEDNQTYFLHGDSTRDVTAFLEAFGRCLDYIMLS